MFGLIVLEYFPVELANKRLVERTVSFCSKYRAKGTVEYSFLSKRNISFAIDIGVVWECTASQQDNIA